MVDYKKAAIAGAIAGTVLSFLMGKKTREVDYGKIAKYAASGAGTLMAAGYVMAETGRPIAMLASKREVAGWGHDFEGHEHRPIGHEHFHRW
jgi:hypothetical protein